MNVPRLFVPPCVKTARRRYVQSPSAGESVNANGVGTGIATPSGAGAARTGSVAGLESRVTAPFWASNRPTTVAPVLSVMEVTAKIEPWRTELTPIVAELPTAQKTFTACDHRSQSADESSPVIVAAAKPFSLNTERHNGRKPRDDIRPRKVNLFAAVCARNGRAECIKIFHNRYARSLTKNSRDFISKAQLARELSSQRTQR